MKEVIMNNKLAHFKTEELIEEIKSRCRNFSIAIELPTNSNKDSVIVSWGENYFTCLGMAVSLVQDMQMSVDTNSDPKDE